MVETPMLDKLAAENHRTENAHEFLEWVGDKDIKLCRWDDDRGRWIGLSEWSIRDLMAEFIGIDLAQVEREKEALLESIREQNGWRQ